MVRDETYERVPFSILRNFHESSHPVRCYLRIFASIAFASRLERRYIRRQVVAIYGERDGVCMAWVATGLY